MRDRVRLRNQGIKESRSEGARGKDEWALNESIMINQDASPSPSPPLPLFLLRLIILLIIITTQTQKTLFSMAAPSCIPIRTYSPHTCSCVFMPLKQWRAGLCSFKVLNQPSHTEWLIVI